MAAKERVQLNKHPDPVDVTADPGGDRLLELVKLAEKYQYEVSQLGMLNVRGFFTYSAKEVLTLQ